MIEAYVMEADLGRIAALQGNVGTVCFGGEGSRWKVRMFMPAAAHRTVPSLPSGFVTSPRRPP